MANIDLNNARAAKKDEFYTQFYDIEVEMEACLDYNPYVFRGKTVLLPCDDPEWSNFTKFFAQNFERLGLKKLISTSYASESMTYKNGVQLSLFETQSPKYDTYDNYEAIEIPYTDAIPSDYDGLMGVPISFIDKYCPEQFEIVGITENNERLRPYWIDGYGIYDRPYINGVRKYPRLLIRKKQ